MTVSLGEDDPLRKLVPRTAMSVWVSGLVRAISCDVGQYGKIRVKCITRIAVYLARTVLVVYDFEINDIAYSTNSIPKKSMKLLYEKS